MDYVTIWWPHVLCDKAALGTLGTLRPGALHLQGIAAKLPSQVATQRTDVSALHCWRHVVFRRHRLKQTNRSHALHFFSMDFLFSGACRSLCFCVRVSFSTYHLQRSPFCVRKQQAQNSLHPNFEVPGLQRQHCWSLRRHSRSFCRDLK